MISSWSITRRIIAILALGCISLAVVGTVSYRSTDTLLETANKRAKARKILMDLNQVTADLDKAESGARAYLLLPQARFASQIGQASKTMDTTLSDLNTLVGSDAKARQSVDAIANLVHGRFAGLGKLLEARRASATRTGSEILEADSDDKTLEKLKQEFVEIDQIEKAALKAHDHEAVSAAQFVKSTVLWGSVLTVLWYSVTGFMLTRYIRASLGAAVSQLGTSANSIFTSAQQVSVSSHSLAQGASEQAASVEQTSACGEELDATTAQNVETARSTADFTNQVDVQLKSSASDLTQMVQTMDEIGNSSEKISKIIKVVEDIAFQTNLLALNAAIEAARAGEAGLGFAVVADEVRKLAQRSSQAAKDTEQLIAESVRRSSDGKKAVTQVSEAFKLIAENSGQITSRISQVKASSEEQAKGISQISKAMVQISTTAMNSAAIAESSSAASQDLNNQADALKRIVRSIKQVVEGGATPAGRR